MSNEWGHQDFALKVRLQFNSEALRSFQGQINGQKKSAIVVRNRMQDPKLVVYSVTSTSETYMDGQKQGCGGKSGRLKDADLL